MASNINPSLTPVNSLDNFRFWCQKVLPLVYDDSLSYYEVLGKMVVQLNDVIDNVNADTDNVLTLKDAFLELQTYVNNFFDDIDQLASYAERAEAAQTAANTSAVNAASSASNASASSLAAMDARDTAVAARQAAQASANTASTAATNANTKANEAAQSAITAQTAQASASQSATLAATDRSAAQTAASTATNKANEANTSATNAETSAENAAQSEANAEELVNNIQENLDNIQQNTQDISDLKESFNASLDANSLVANTVDSLQEELLDNVKYHPSWRRGEYALNGFNTNTLQIAVSAIKFPAGRYTISPESGYDFAVFEYISDTQGAVRLNYRSVVTTVTVPRDFYVNCRHTVVTNLTDAEVIDMNSHLTITRHLDFTPVFAPGISTDVLTELYVPNLEEGWKVFRVYAESTSFRFGITDKDGNTILDGLDNVGTSYSDAVNTLIDSDGNIIAYYVLHYTGTDYFGGGNRTPDLTLTSNIDNSPKIKELLSREENLVLIGDSLFGYQDQNLLESKLNSISKKHVFNCGFGGCTMALRNSNYDAFSFVGIADAIATGTFTDQDANVGLVPIYKRRLTTLKDIDWSKPTTVFIDYVNNDITTNVPIGDEWEYTDSSTDFDKTTVLGALYYGVATILAVYPHVKFVFFTPSWRCIEVNDVKLPPYAYTNGLNLTSESYREAIISNCEKMGVSVYDFFKYGGTNFYNKEYMRLGGTSHFTIKGYDRLANALNNLDNSFIS